MVTGYLRSVFGPRPCPFLLAWEIEEVVPNIYSYAGLCVKETA